MSFLHHKEEIINNRYRILHTLGAGGVGVTYAAKDLDLDNLVAIKVLSLNRMNSWKALELFQREAKILKKLEHPNIPNYLDSFEIDTENNRAFYLVQQLAPGKPLSELITSGWKPQEAQVKDIARQILDILVYLQRLNPAIIHRDIKPHNIIRQSNGKIFLVDFGAVQDTYHHTVTGGSTVVGTFGYMAPEQFRGRANITSDLYGLGTTLLYLLTRKDPSELPQKNLKILFRQQVCIARDFADWLDRMLAPSCEDRFTSAREALAVLTGEQKLTILGTKKVKKPQQSHASLKKTKDKLTITIPPGWQYSNLSKLLVLGLVSFNLVIALAVWIAIESHFLNILLDELNKRISYGLLLWLLIVINGKGYGRILCPALGFTYIRIETKRFTVRKWLTKYKLGKVLIYEDPRKIEQARLKHFGEPFIRNVVTFCSIPLSNFDIQAGLFLPRKEQKWLVKEINYFLEQIDRN